MHIPGLVELVRRFIAFCRTSVRRRPERRPNGAYQVAALPVKVSRSGKLEVLLISTRGSPGKLIIPRGWPMKGKADFQAAAIEAEEEAGVLGPVTLHPVGTYDYSKARIEGGEPIRVDVYRLDVKRRVPEFKERGQRRLVWLGAKEAARQVSEPGLVPIIETLALDDAFSANDGSPRQ